MHITTHLLMANIFYKEITAQTGIQLDYIHYVYGNIKPDINPGDMEWGHYLYDSLEGVLSCCDAIVKTPLSVKEFSKTLGMISHFVCDYYCLYHTEAYKRRSLAQHTLYEHFLELRFIKKCALGQVKITEESYGENIEEIINRNCELYEQEAHSIEKDIQYAVNTALSVVKKVIDRCEVQREHMGNMKVSYEF